MNERFNLPSASAFGRLEKCPASHKLGLKAEEQGLVPPSGDDTDSGTRIHAALAGDILDTPLTEHEQRVAEMCESQANEIVQSVFGGTEVRNVREIRLAMTADGISGQPLFPATKHDMEWTGQPDLIVVSRSARRRGVIIEYKSLYGDHESAVRNPQLRAQAVLASRYWGLTDIRVAIVQPLAGPPSVADYDQLTLDESYRWAKHVVDRTKEDSDPVPGDHCRYCPARLICPTRETQLDAVAGTLHLPAKLPTERTEVSQLKQDLEFRAMTLPGERLALVLDMLRPLQWMAEAAKAAARARIKAGETLPGWELATEPGNREITDVDAASQAVAPLLANADGGIQSALLRCATLSAADLTEEIRKASGAVGNPESKFTRYRLTAKAAKAALESALGDLMTRVEKEILRKTKPELT